MLRHPFITVLRSFNNSKTVNDCSHDFIDTLERMKIERVENRMKTIKKAFDEGIESSKKICEMGSNGMDKLKSNILSLNDHIEAKLSQQRITNT